MKRPRPYIPLSVKIDVVHRQLQKMGKATVVFENETRKSQLAGLLRFLGHSLGCEPADLRLDHDPALILRPFVDGFYSPEANDPRYLIYREKADHQQKTTGRKPGAERTVTTKGSDVGLAAKFRRLENPNPRRRAKIPSRPFQKRVK